MMRILEASMLAPLVLAFVGCANQDYLLGYNRGFDVASNSCEQFKKLDLLMCRDDLNDAKASLQICEGALKIYKFGAEHK